MSRRHHSTDRVSAGDRISTPAWVAADLVRHFSPTGTVLEPCRGDGAIYRLLPPGSLWCEITDGRDFFDLQTPVDWIVTNPPYSQTRNFMRHAFSLAGHVVLLVPARNVFSGYGTVRSAIGYGAMRDIRWYGTGSKLGFPMGNAIAAIHWQRGYRGDTKQSFYEDEDASR